MAGNIRDRGTSVRYHDKDIVLTGTSHIETLDVVPLIEDFLGDTLDANLWSSVADTGCTAAAINVQPNGVARLVTDTTDEDRVDFAGEIIWRPSKGLIFEARVKVDDVDNVAINIGLSDAKSEAAQTIAATLSGTTFTTTASNACLWLYDTDATTKTWRPIGVKADTDAGGGTSGVTPVAATYERFRIEVDTSGNAVFKLLDDTQPHVVAYQAYVANACTAATSLVPYVAVQNKSGSAHILDVDYIKVWQLGRI